MGQKGTNTTTITVVFGQSPCAECVEAVRLVAVFDAGHLLRGCIIVI